MTKLIVAYCKGNRVIGFKNSLPWPRLKGDLPRFKELTTGNTVIMGRNTWLSFPVNKQGVRILPDRSNIVLSRDAENLSGLHEREGRPLYFMSDIEEAVRRGQWLSTRGDVYIIGGEQIYREALNLGLVNEIIASEITTDHEGDAFFPELGPEWNTSWSEKCEGYDLTTYIKGISAKPSI